MGVQKQGRVTRTVTPEDLSGTNQVLFAESLTGRFCLVYHITLESENSTPPEAYGQLPSQDGIISQGG